MIQVITLTQRSATLPGLVLENIVCCAVGPGTRMGVFVPHIVVWEILISGAETSVFAALSRHNPDLLTREKSAARMI